MNSVAVVKKRNDYFNLNYVSVRMLQPTRQKSQNMVWFKVPELG